MTASLTFLEAAAAGGGSAGIEALTQNTSHLPLHPSAILNSAVLNFQKEQTSLPYQVFTAHLLQPVEQLRFVLVHSLLQVAHAVHHSLFTPWARTSWQPWILIMRHCMLHLLGPRQPNLLPFQVEHPQLPRRFKRILHTFWGHRVLTQSKYLGSSILFWRRRFSV